MACAGRSLQCFQKHLKKLFVSYPGSGFVYLSCANELNNSASGKIIYARAEKMSMITCITRSFSSTTMKDLAASEKEQAEGKKKPKTAEVPKIMLLSDREDASVVTLEEAQKIAKRKNFQLIRTTAVEAKIHTERPVYKLVTLAQSLKDDHPSDSDGSTSKTKKTKEVKTLLLKSKIADHDTLSKTNNIKKWVNKGHTVKVVIGQAGDTGNSEHVFKTIELALKDENIKIHHKVTKNSQVRFEVLPVDKP